MNRLRRQTLLAAVLALVLRGESMRLVAADPTPLARTAAAAPTAVAAVSAAPALAQPGLTVAARFGLDGFLSDGTRMFQVAAIIVVLAIYILMRK